MNYLEAIQLFAEAIEGSAMFNILKKSFNRMPLSVRSLLYTIILICNIDYTKMDRQVNLMDIQSDATSQLVFHPFDDNIIVTDSKNRIQVWQYIEPARVNLFSNGNLPGTRITSLQLINDKDFPFLMTGAGKLMSIVLF